MSDTHETHAAVIAEYRADADKMDARALYQPTTQYVRKLLNRLEAAHKRELAVVGDAAKLREALVAIDKNTDLLDIAENIAPKLHPSHSFVAVQIRKIVRAALSAPPRNCDRFATVEDARKAHEAICEKYGKCHNGCPLNNEEHYSAFDCFEAWLFALVADRKEA